MPDATARDEFLTEASEAVDNKYSPDKFYTASRNKKGFASTLRVNLPPEVLSIVSQLVQSKVIPEYTTGEAFFRDAIVHRLKYIEGMVKDDRVPLTKAAKLMMELDASAKFHSERETVERTLKNYEESLQMAEGRDKQAILKRLREGIVTMDDDTFTYRGNQIVKRFDI